MSKNILFTALTIVLFVTVLLAQKSITSIETRWKTVEELAGKQLPESALKEVEAILLQARHEKNSAELIKAMVYKMRFTLEKNPDEAPALIRDFEAFTDKSTDPAERALLHSMTAELYAQYYQKDQYNINQRTEITGFVPEDMKEWSKNIFFDKISKHLAASMENPTVLQHTDALKFSALLYKGKDSQTLQPTLFEFLAYSRIEVLKQIAQATVVKNPLNNAELFADIPQLLTIKPDTTFKNSIENPILETYQQILSFRLKEKNVLAFLYADLNYLTYLKQQSGLSNGNPLYLAALNRLKKQYDDHDAVIEVYIEIANYYIERSKLPENKSYKKIAYDLCAEGLKRFPDYNRNVMLENIQHTITQKRLSVINNQVVKPGTNLKIQVTSANIALLKLSVYRLKASALEYYSFKQKNDNYKTPYPDRTLLETRNIPIEPDPNFGIVKTTVSVNTSDYGIYEYSLQETDYADRAQSAFGNYTVTDLAFIIRTNKPDLVDLCVLDRKTGNPQPEVNVTSYVVKWSSKIGYELDQAFKRETNKNGYTGLPGNSTNNEHIYSFERGDDRYYLSNSYYSHNQQYTPKNVIINLFTDRSLYRPGQTVYFKGIAFYPNQGTIGGGCDVTLVDANGQMISSKRLEMNEFGSFAGEFVLPEGGLNGMYELNCNRSSQPIWVEEYKRPTFEVKIDKPKTEVSFGEKVTLKGNVKGYAGNFVNDAKIKYRVVRRTHRYCWWISEPDKEITNGMTVSKIDGSFDVSFIPEKTRSEEMPLRGQFYTYTVYADVTDQKGETQRGEQSFSVGDKSLFILADVPDKIDKKQTFTVDVRTETLNGEKMNSTIRYKLYRLSGTDQYFDEDIEESIAEDIVPISELKTAKKVLSGTFDTKDKTLILKTGRLISGLYRIQFNTTDAHGKEVQLEKTVVIYDVNDKKPPVKSYSWVVAPKTECDPGEKAQIHFGTSTLNSWVLYELMQGNTVLESRWIPFSNEIKTFDIPFKESYGAGVTVMFTFIKDEHFFTKSIQLTRKKIDKKLTPTLSVFRNKLLPGEKAEWTISIPESAKYKKRTELMVEMYDASLDGLRKHDWLFNPENQAEVPESPVWTETEMEVGSNAIFQVPYRMIKTFEFNRLNWFGLRFGLRFYVDIADVVESITQVTGATGIVRSATKKKSVVRKVSTEQHGELAIDTNENTPIKIRTNFNETAFFYPQLRTDSLGNVKFTFTAPESLTRWNVKMLAHTKDLYFGQGEAQVVTQKDLMVQMNLPRFVRRSDKLVLSAGVTNLTDKEQTATVQFEMINPATEKGIPLKDATSKTVSLTANETKTVEWEITEFSPYELVTCKVTARAGDFSDGEQKYLPVLPDKILVTESMPLTIRGKQTRIFNFENLLKNGSAMDTKSLTVEFASNPTWYAVQALTTLAIPESDNAIDDFAAYYVNTLAAYLANSNPKITAIFDRWKKEGGSREALLSNLEKNKELKNMLLEETPWVMAAKDETEQKHQIALLFDLNMQNNQAQQYLDKLISLQMPSGGFSWFKNMPESRYITQEIVLNLGRLHRMTESSMPAAQHSMLDAQRSTLDAQHSMLNAALKYLDLEIARDFDNLKKKNKNYEKEMIIDNMQLFYLHMRSEYPDIPVNVAAQEAVKFNTSQSEKYWTNLTLYGKAMMAMVAHRNGKEQVATDILKSLKENALKTDEFGMYWAKNTPGYFWNERPVAVQAAIVEAFAEVSKNQADLDEMKLWLLKQKQTQRWDSPLATVDAIYALLHYGADWLANDGNVKITLGNKSLRPASLEAGTGYFKQTIPPADIRSDIGKVTVSSAIGSATLSRAPNVGGIGCGAMYWQYYQDLDKVSGQSGPLKITKKLFVEKMTPTNKTMLPIEQTELKKGDKVITRLVITTDRNLEFVALKDLRAACFEPVNQLSGSQWKEGVCYYQTTKDASTQYFFTNLPKGTYVFEYELWTNSTGEYTSGIASLQCQYAPEFVSHTGGERIRVN